MNSNTIRPFNKTGLVTRRGRVGRCARAAIPGSSGACGVTRLRLKLILLDALNVRGDKTPQGVALKAQNKIAQGNALGYE